MSEANACHSQASRGHPSSSLLARPDSDGPMNADCSMQRTVTLGASNHVPLLRLPLHAAKLCSVQGTQNAAEQSRVWGRIRATFHVKELGKEADNAHTRFRSIPGSTSKCVLSNKGGQPSGLAPRHMTRAHDISPSLLGASAAPAPRGRNLFLAARAR